MVFLADGTLASAFRVQENAYFDALASWATEGGSGPAGGPDFIEEHLERALGGMP